MWKLFAGIGFVLMLAYLVDSVGMSQHRKQKPWECHPYPGYCDIDLDWHQK